MKYVNCPICGNKLFEGYEGSRVVVKCNKCNRLFDATVEQERIEIIVKSKIKDCQEKKAIE